VAIGLLILLKTRMPYIVAGVVLLNSKGKTKRKKTKKGEKKWETGIERIFVFRGPPKKGGPNSAVGGSGGGTLL